MQWPRWWHTASQDKKCVGTQYFHMVKTHERLPNSLCMHGHTIYLQQFSRQSVSQCGQYEHTILYCMKISQMQASLYNCCLYTVIFSVNTVRLPNVQSVHTVFHEVWQCFKYSCIHYEKCDRKCPFNVWPHCGETCQHSTLSFCSYIHSVPQFGKWDHSVVHVSNSVAVWSQ